MKIYISHASQLDYVTQLHIPLKASALWPAHQFFLPHDGDNLTIRTRDIIGQYDLMIAEVSYASTGQGIEIGLAVAASVPVVAIMRSGVKPSGALRFYVREIRQYHNPDQIAPTIAELVR